MDYKIIITESFFKDLDEILMYITVKLNNPTAGKKLLNEFYSALDTIKSFPFSMMKIKNNKNNKDYRKFFIGNYIVIYIIENDIVKILTIRYAPMRLGDHI